MTTHIICMIYSCMNKALSIDPSGYCFPASWTPHHESFGDKDFLVVVVVLWFCYPSQVRPDLAG